MKIKELLKENFKTVVSHDNVDEIRTVMSTKHIMLGSGSFGEVFQVDSDLTTVTKIAKNSRSYKSNDFSKDGYGSYVLHVLKMQDNPWVPQIHDVYVVAPPDGEKYLVANIEMLTPLSDLDVKDLKVIFERMIDDIIGDDTEFERVKLNDIESPSIIIRHISNMLRTYAENLYASELQNEIKRDKKLDAQQKINLVKKYSLKNKDLIEVMDVVKQLSNIFTYDLAAFNMMVRRTPYGPQLVIVDPVC